MTRARIWKIGAHWYVTFDVHGIGRACTFRRHTFADAVALADACRNSPATLEQIRRAAEWSRAIRYMQRPAGQSPDFYELVALKVVLPPGI